MELYKFVIGLGLLVAIVLPYLKEKYFSNYITEKDLKTITDKISVEICHNNDLMHMEYMKREEIFQTFMQVTTCGLHQESMKQVINQGIREVSITVEVISKDLGEIKDYVKKLEQDK